MADRRQTEEPGPRPGVTEETGADEGFLRRWARLKQESHRGSAPAPAESRAPEAPPSSPTVADEPAEPPGDEDMPPLETLGPDSDYSAFLSPRVSAELRRKALRQLFRSPQFNVCDGLDVYAEDLTKMAPLGNVMTADLKFRMERKLKEQLAKMAEAEGEEGGAPQGPGAADAGEQDGDAGTPGSPTDAKDDDDRSNA